jgi:DNA-binding response OmpR family regulator
MPGTKPKTILVASRNPDLADIRKQVLEAAGFRVVPAMDLRVIEKTCKDSQVDLVIIGYSLPAAEKRRVCVECRKYCSLAPVLELYDAQPPALAKEARTFIHHSRTPEDFLETVQTILAKSKAQSF